MLQNVCKNLLRILEEEKHPRILLLLQRVREASSTSTHSHSQQLNISEPSLRRILHKDLGITLYKIRFAKWGCDEEDADLGKKIIFSDEIHFGLCGYVNKRND